MSFFEIWPEIPVLKENEHQHTIKLSGSVLQKRIEKSDGIIPEQLFIEVSDQIHSLQLSNAPIITELPRAISHLQFLQDLTLSGNGLTQLPSEVGTLSCLKILLLDGNKLNCLPPTLRQLSALRVLNLSSNAFEEFPFVLCHMSSLASLDCSSNMLTEVPSIKRLKLLHTLIAAHNRLTTIHSSIGELESLKTLDVSHNALTSLPSELANCIKIKDLLIDENPFADKKILKLAGNTAKTKDVLKVLRDGQSKGQAKMTKKVAVRAEEDSEKPQITVHRNIDAFDVISRIGGRSVRPYLVCCVIRGLSFDETSFRRFIQMQTEIHQGLGGQRTLACIGTHDLSKIKGPFIYYEADKPENIKFTPLKYEKEVSATELLKLFEVDQHMKRHLKLVEDSELFPFLTDSAKQVLSLLPLVNSEYSKVTLDTKDVFIECSSDCDFASTKAVMDAILFKMQAEGMLTTAASLEQTRVVDESGTLRLLYPSKIDLPDFCLHFI